MPRKMPPPGGISVIYKGEIVMEFLDRYIDLCFGCMEYHVVYEVIYDGEFARYCYRSDTVTIPLG